jgi:Skp family chaperone for outer membrane proteins
MIKEWFILAVSIVTLFVAGYAAYSVYDMDQFQPQTAIADVKDYTFQLKSIEKTLTEVTQKLDQLETKTIKELEKTRTDLEGIKKATKELEVISNKSPLLIELNKSTYTKDDSILITAQNFSPQQIVTIQLLSSSNEIISHTTAHTDSTGKIFYWLPIPNNIISGSYKIKAITSEGNVDEVFFKISDNTNSQSKEAQPTKLTVNLNKQNYKPGDVIQLTGFGTAGGSISAELTNPDGRTLTAHSTVLNDRTYTMILILDQNARVGDWILKVSHGTDIETYTIKVTN